jgi:hypothetical protein
MLISSLCKCVKLAPLIKPCMILGVFYFWFMTGKSSWIPSSTQGLFSTCCRWPILFWVLQVLSPSSQRWGLDRRARSLLVILSKLLLWDVTLSLVMYLNLRSYVPNYVAFATQTWFVIILFWTPMDVIRMLLVNHCNEWCVVLNRYDLGLYVESCLKSFEIFRLPGLWEPKYRNLITSVIVFVLTFL